MTFIYLRHTVRDRGDGSTVLTVERILNTDNISSLTRDGNLLTIEFNDTSELTIEFDTQDTTTSRELWNHLYGRCENVGRIKQSDRVSGDRPEVGNADF